MSEHADVSTNDDPRVVQMLSTEHWSVLSARSLVYNEAFARAGMFLTFLSTSTVALGLLAQGTGFDRNFLVITSIVLAFDLIIGLATFTRLAHAGHEDLLALHGMSRIRHAYTQIAPELAPYFTAPVHDDVRSVMAGYGSPPMRGLGAAAHLLSTTGGMIGLIVAMLGGVLVGVITLIVSGSGAPSLIAGVLGTAAVFMLLLWTSARLIRRNQGSIPVLFPDDASLG